MNVYDGGSRGESQWYEGCILRDMTILHIACIDLSDCESLNEI